MIRLGGSAGAVLAALLLFAGCGGAQPDTSGEFVFGVILNGAIDDKGWNQANYQAGRAIEAQIPGTRMIYIDNVNAVAKPGVTVPQVAQNLIDGGAKLIITTSEEFGDGAVEAALTHPRIRFLSTGSDLAWKQGRNYKAPANMSTAMGRMEYGKMMAGFAAALTTQTGKLGYIGPLINEESRRLAAATYLGANYAWTQVLKRDPAQLKFQVIWIGFWFNLPGQTLDPTNVADDFIENGCDVLISGINTTEALVEAGQFRRRGRQVWAVPYDCLNAGDEAPETALGVPYFNWYPIFSKAVLMAQGGTWRQYHDWAGPDWRDINDSATSAVGFLKGKGLSPENGSQLDSFVRDLGDGAVELWSGPLLFQDSSVFLRAGEQATDQQIFYLPQLLAGMQGKSR